MTLSISIFQHTRDVVPVHEDFADLADLAAFFEHDIRDTRDGVLWSPARYAEGTTRAKSNVIELSCLALDLDALDGAGALALLEHLDGLGLERWIHSTWKHTFEAPRLRVVLSLSRPVLAAEWPRFWTQASFEIAPGRDAATCDASRFYYVPACPPERAGDVIHDYRAGDVLDVDAVLERADGARGRPVVYDEVAPADPKAITDEIRTWALRRVERRAIEIRAFPPGSGIYAVVRDAGFELGGLVGAGALALDVARDALRAAHRARNPDPERVAEKDALVDKCLTDGAKRPWTPSPWYDLNDVDLADKIAADHGESIRFVASWEKWIGWHDNRWSIEAGEVAVYSAVRGLAKAMRGEAEYASEVRAKALKACARRLSSASGARAVVSMLRTSASLRVSHNALDANPWILGTPSGLIDLERGHVHEHDPARLITRRTSVDPAWDVAAPVWSRFLREITCDDPELVAFLQRAVGYSLTGLVDPHALFFLYGSGGNGKGVFVRTIKHVLGDYAISADPKLLMQKNNDQHPTAKADLYRTRFASISEVDEGKGWDEVELKMLVDSDRIRARRMREDPWEFDPSHHFWVSGNYRPTVRGIDSGIWRRLYLIPFEASFLAKPDPHLERKLRNEASAILAWAVDGCLAWQRQGLAPPARLTQATDEYRGEQDVVRTFFEERFETAPETCTIPGVQLYQTWVAWCATQGLPAQSQRYLSLRMDRFATRRKTMSGVVWVGLRARGASHLAVVK